MKTLSEQIQELQEKINARKDQLVEATKALEVDASDENEGAVVEHTAELERLQARMETLQKAEVVLGTKAKPVTGAPNVVKHLEKSKSAEMLYGKYALCLYEARVKQQPIETIKAARFGEDEVLDTFIKAAQNPAMSSVPGYAQELTHIAYGQFMDLLREEAVVPRCTPLMQQHAFNGASQIYIPMRTGNLTDAAGAFRAEGAPLPVKGLHFTSQILTPKNMGVILTATEEMLRRSSVDLAGIFPTGNCARYSRRARSIVPGGYSANGIIAPPGFAMA